MTTATFASITCQACGLTSTVPVDALHVSVAGVAGSHPGRLLDRPVQARQHEALSDPLSERETQVLRLLDSDLSGPDIARELFVSHNTLRTHTRHIFTKLQVSSRRAAVQRARHQGLL